MSVKGFKNYDEEGNFLGVEKYDYGSLENIPKNFKNDTYEQDIRQLKTDVEKNVTDHNVSKDAHNDIRLLITEIINRINVIADSDDETLDQMSELVAYIKNNKTLIDSITTSKVSFSDIVNDLTTNVSNKPLSAEQGVVLKTLIDNLTRDLDTHGLSGNHIPTGGSSGQILKWLSSGKAQWAKETVYASTTHKHSATDINSGILPISRGGTGGTTEEDAMSSLGFISLKQSISLGGEGMTDLDTIKTPGTYGCYASGALAKLTNCPTEKTGFVMYVESGDVMGTTVYTIQIIRDIKHRVFIRKIRSNDIGVSWKKIIDPDFDMSLKTYTLRDTKWSGLTIKAYIFHSLNIGFAFINGKTTEDLKDISIGGSACPYFTSPIGYTPDSFSYSLNQQDIPVKAKLPDGSYHDRFEFYVSNDNDGKMRLHVGTNSTFLSNKILPSGTRVWGSGIFLVEPL